MNDPGVMESPVEAGFAQPDKIEVAELVAEMSDLIGNGSRPAAAVAEAREILSYLLGVSRSWPAAHAEAGISAPVAVRAIKAAQKRALGAPIQYSAGLAAFRNLTLEVDERVLIPRPETEMLVDLVLSRISTGVAVDIGTGSGAIALALATEGAFTRVIASDVSLDALAVARRNADLLRPKLITGVEFVHGSGAAHLRGICANVIVSNPPYISFAESVTLDEQVRDWEPPLALFAASDGMAVISQIVDEAQEFLVSGGLLALEVDSRRAQLAADLAAQSGWYRDISVLTDLTGRERFLFAHRI